MSGRRIIMGWFKKKLLEEEEMGIFQDEQIEEKDMESFGATEELETKEDYDNLDSVVPLGGNDHE